MDGWSAERLSCPMASFCQIGPGRMPRRDHFSEQSVAVASRPSAGRVSLAELLILLGLASGSPVVNPGARADDLAAAPDKLQLQIPNDMPGKHCMQIGPSDL